MTVNDYFAGAEEMRRRELVWGVLRDAPSPLFAHQSVVTRVTVLLDLHVWSHGLGVVCVSPIDVVLDEARALVVQPDLVYVSNERSDIIRDRIWGAPDLVVEVSSPGTARRDRTTKLRWYRDYGVKECWIVAANGITVVALQGKAVRRRTVRGEQIVHSKVLPALRVTADDVFAR
jgi:Uma2 family endonuclease